MINVLRRLRLRKINAPLILASLVLFLAISGFDVTLSIQEPFRGFKELPILAAMLSVVFIALNLVHFSLAWLISYSLFMWWYLDYPLPSILMVMSVLSVLVAAWGIKKLVSAELMQKVIAASLWFECIIATLQVAGVYLLYVPYFKEQYHIPIGTWGQETVLGAYLCAGLPIALFTKRYWLSFFVVSVCLATGSAMTAAGVLAGVLIYLGTIIKPKFILPIAAVSAFVVIGACVVLGRQDLLSLHGRQILWVQAWDAFKLNPWFGSGPGAWSYFWAPSLGPVGQGIPFKVHNDYLQLLVDLGVVGAVPVFAGIAWYYRKFKFTWPWATCTAVLVNAIGNFPFHLAGIGLVFAIAFLYTIDDSTGGGL